MKQTIHSVQRYICDMEVTREELLAHKVKNPVLDVLYQTVLQRVDGQKLHEAEKKIS